MSWQIKQAGSTTVLALAGELGIHEAADFYQAVLPLAGLGDALRVEASAAKSIHTSIMQILYALSRAVADFEVTAASDDFRATEARLGLSLARNAAPETPANPSGT